MQTRLKVLIVDDEANTLYGLDELLRLKGYQVEFVDTAEAALQTTRTAPCDVVIADYRMPGLNGIQLMEAIHSLEPRTKVIIMTGYANVDSVIEAFKKGAYSYFKKPLDIKELTDTLGKIADSY